MKEETRAKIFEHLEAIKELMEEPSQNVEKAKVLEDLLPGAKFTYQDREYIRLGNEQGGILCITADLWRTEQRFGDNANYKESEIKELLEKEFWGKKKDKNVLDYTMDLTSDNGDDSLGTCTAKVGLLTCDLIRKYYKVIPKYKEWWWTCTPWAISSLANLVRLVNPSGALNVSHANSTSGVVPACILDGQTLISCDSN